MYGTQVKIKAFADLRRNQPGLIKFFSQTHSARHVACWVIKAFTAPHLHDNSARQRATTTCSTAHDGDKQPRRPSGYQAPSWCSCKTIVAAGAACVLAISSAEAAEELTITFKASRDPEIRKVQKSLVEAWGVCTTTCFHVHERYFG